MLEKAMMLLKNRETSKNQPGMLAKSIHQNPLSEQAKSTQHVNKINKASKQNQLNTHAKSIRHNQ
jgi:hypothetical protein